MSASAVISDPPTKLDTARPSDLLPRLELPPEAAARLEGCGSISDAVTRLESGGFLVEAARLCAHALPNREAVWWAARCAGHTAPPDLPEADRAACELAEQWVRRRTDEVRRAAMERAQAAGFTSPEAWAAVAAFWSGDSMSPPDQPKVQPAPHLTGTATAGSVILASVRIHPERQVARLRRFLQAARDIANGGAGNLDHEEA